MMCLYKTNDLNIGPDHILNALFPPSFVVYLMLTSIGLNHILNNIVVLFSHDVDAKLHTWH